jgi:hypothetical protein
MNVLPFFHEFGVYFVVVRVHLVSSDLHEDVGAVDVHFPAPVEALLSSPFEVEIRVVFVGATLAAGVHHTLLGRCGGIEVVDDFTIDLLLAFHNILHVENVVVLLKDDFLG